MLVAVYDRQTKSFCTQPISFNTKRDALESWRNIVNETEGNYSKFPEDFYLAYLGEFNQKTGLLEPLDEPEKLAEAKDMKIQ